MDREEAIRRIKAWNLDSDDMEVLAVVIPELAESEDERMYARVTGRYTRFEKYYLRALGETEANKVLKQCEEEELWIKNLLKKQKDLDKMIVVSPEVWDNAISDAFENGKKDNEKQKEQKPIIQDVELNNAVYDYVRDHFIAGADFTPEYIKKLMENAFFAGVDYYLLKQESESCESDTNVEKVIEDVIRVYGKTQGKWVGGYDVDTLIVNLRRAFNKKEQKPINNSTREKIISRATSEKQVVLLSESSGKAEIGWDTRSLEDAKNLLEYGLAFINEQLGAKPEKWDEEFEENIRKLLYNKLRWDSEDGRISTAVFIDDKTLKDIVTGIWFYVGKEAMKNPNMELPKQEWSNEDEEKLKAICTYLRDYSRLAKLGDKLRFNEYCDFLQSLRPSWKPSEEQMKALKEVAYNIVGTGTETDVHLVQLYEQLKKF